MESANLDQYEKTLADQQYLGGQLPTAADREAYESLKNTPPSVATHPNTFAWFVLLHRFSDAIRNSWAGAQAAPAKGGDKKTAAPAKKEEAPKKNDDDDMDLFGDDDEEDLEAKKKLEEAKKANAKKAKDKPAAKSLILFEVKPYEAETDLDDLAK